MCMCDIIMLYGKWIHLNLAINFCTKIWGNFFRNHIFLQCDIFCSVDIIPLLWNPYLLCILMSGKQFWTSKEQPLCGVMYSLFSTGNRGFNMLYFSDCFQSALVTWINPSVQWCCWFCCMKCIWRVTDTEINKHSMNLLLTELYESSYLTNVKVLYCLLYMGQRWCHAIHDSWSQPSCVADMLL